MASRLSSANASAKWSISRMPVMESRGMPFSFIRAISTSLESFSIGLESRRAIKTLPAASKMSISAIASRIMRDTRLENAYRLCAVVAPISTQVSLSNGAYIS